MGLFLRVDRVAAGWQRVVEAGRRKGAANMTELLVERTVMSVADRYDQCRQI